MFKATMLRTRRGNMKHSELKEYVKHPKSWFDNFNFKFRNRIRRARNTFFLEAEALGKLSLAVRQRDNVAVLEPQRITAKHKRQLEVAGITVGESSCYIWFGKTWTPVDTKRHVIVRYLMVGERLQEINAVMLLHEFTCRDESICQGGKPAEALSFHRRFTEGVSWEGVECVVLPYNAEEDRIYCQPRIQDDSGLMAPCGVGEGQL